MSEAPDSAARNTDLSQARSGREPVAIGDWVLHADLGVLRRGDQEHRLNAKALHVLLVLLDAEGAAVSRQALLDAVWGNRYPTDAVVSRAIADLRSALGDSAGESTCIRTVPKFGYQLVATASQPPAPDSTAQRPWLYAVSLLLALAAVWSFWPPGRDVEKPAGRLQLPLPAPLTADPGLEHQPRMTPGGEWVVYAALRPGQGDWDIFRLATDDLRTQAVAAVTGVHEHGPAISPDGEQVAYVRYSGQACEVVVQAINFGLPQPVANCTVKFPTLVDWSPDGQSVAYTTAASNDGDGYRRLYQVALNDGSSRALSAAVSPTGSDFYPRYSPAGGQVAFLRGEPQPDHRSSLWVVATDTGEERRLTAQPAQLGGMSWLDEERLLYTINAAGRLEMHVVSLATGLTYPIEGPDLAHPEFDAESRQLIAAALRSERDLAVIASDGTVAAIASSTSDDHHGVLQPGGRYAAYISRRSGFDEIWLIDLASATSRQLTRFGGATIRYPAWHPDGLRLLFSVQSEAGERLYELDIVSGATVAVGEPTLAATTPAWLPDGRRYSFACNHGDGWGICLADDNGVRRLAEGLFHPVAIAADTLVAIDTGGTLYRIEVASGERELLWDGMPGTGRSGWTLHGEHLYYVAPDKGGNGARLVRRNMTNGAEQTLYAGPMPLTDTTLSYAATNEQLLFTRFQAASDDLVRFDLTDSPDFP